MPGFADSFWTPDYASGLGILYSKLQQGIAENRQILILANLRADAEEAYSTRLGDITPAVDRITTGFSKDEGASVRKAYDGIRGEMIEASKNHQKIASNIRELVVNPFSRWCDQHAARVQSSHDDLQARIKDHMKQTELVKKLRSQYFNKCRLVEDLEEENKLAFQSPEATSPKGKPPAPKIVLTDPQESDEPEIFDLGDKSYSIDEIKKILTDMLNTIKIGEVKVPILGTYQNTSTGADIVEYLQQKMEASSISHAERIGQDMVDLGFLRLIGNMGSTFANSSRMNYQWRSKVFQLTGMPENKKPLLRMTSLMSNDEAAGSPTMSSVSEMLSGWNPLNNPYPDETPAEKLHREARETDERYKTAVIKLDQIRCILEEEIIDHLRFMERCELDRLKAIKSVVLDFSGAISNVIPGLQSTVDHMMLYQETIQPLGDLRYLLENYRTGGFAPKVQPYENYYGSVGDQVFGVDLEARARADRKRVPVIVTNILTFLDNHYPDLEGDDARRAIWLHDVPLAATHHLRQALNNSAGDHRAILEKYEIPIVASVLKLYLLELPDSLVSSQVYEIVKTIYSATANETSEEGRIKVLQSTLGQLRLNNIATLDALMTHFTRLIDLTSADETYIAALAQTLAPCILRPRLENTLTLNERHSYRLIRDLFDHKDAIFGELKRQSSASSTLGAGAGSARPRAISTDESNRRAAVEARNRAIASRSRATSPAPGARHRRDRSTDGSQGSGRFPINVGSPHGSERRNPRQSLDVPSSTDLHVATESKPAEEKDVPNGAAEEHNEKPAEVSATITDFSDPVPVPEAADDASEEQTNNINSSEGSPTPTASVAPIEKRDSLTRGRHVRRAGGSHPPSDITKRTSLVADGELKGVTLEDKPMEDFA
ncbi:RhoGAP and Fes/CIP4 domain protein [Talaromyces stipitatus ATCC 10500]|uniref:RhoGAP and Fes/CIP4 domain protein n=1 Tax=Talaromyces stipitatus (strain ATCC 10500 / CBS 375.48 / QM 6759 / NRRL 1006) TaxID=441959 RepID=B8LZE4_TALSN|nr:RhoGAP and Fes/CIP4 domain protein [Talaromyces stipitatus ATCC 10500]EED21697.1 RhoGAP and Fes/CIP4 domain protein [Talaromyces stipitatus ATCC 10500]